MKGSKDRFRDFVFIDDVVDAWMLAFLSPAAIGKTYNLGSGQKTSVEQVLAGLKTACGKPDYPVEFADGTPGDQSGMILDISKIQKEIGFKPKTCLEEGLKEMFKYETGDE